MVEIATSLLSIDEESIVKNIYDIEVAGTDYFHIDVMDGEFVKNNTIEKMMKYTEYIKQVANTKIEVHLMVKDVENFIKAYIDMDVDSIIFHIEACKNENEVMKLISLIKENNIKVGLSLNPKTEAEKIYQYIPYIHKVLVMTVEPGKGGQEFLKDVTEKIKKINIFGYENDCDLDIEVDGGINDKTAKIAIGAGANILVAGSYIANSKDYRKAIESLKK